MEDCQSIYRVPLLLQEQHVLKFLVKKLQLMSPIQSPSLMLKWKNLVDRYENIREEVKIVLVGKYTKFGDAYISVIKALKHAALFCRRKLDLKVWE